MSTRAVLSLTVITVFAAGLAACGGGSVSTGGAGGGSGGATSSMVVQVSGDGRVSGLHPGAGQENSVASAVSNLLIRAARAQTAGVPIYVDGTEVAVTDGTGTAAVPLAPGTYEVCVLDPDVPDNCVTVVIEPDSVVVVSNVNIAEDGSVTFGEITTESAQEHVAEFQDPDNANKTLVCHQTAVGQFTISVGTPAALTGHQVHGDTLGPCPEDTQVDNGGGDDDDGRGPPSGVPGPPDDVPANRDDDDTSEA